MITGVTVHVENLSALPALQQGLVSKHIVDMGRESSRRRKKLIGGVGGCQGV